MSTVNKVILIGHLGTDVKMHYFDANNCVGRFSLATNESYVNKQTGERVERTEWHNLTVNNKAAEICAKYLSKGDKIYIEGKLNTRKWVDDKQLEHYTTEIKVKEFTFLSTKKKEDAPAPGPNAGASAAPNENSEDHDDLPF